MILSLKTSLYYGKCSMDLLAIPDVANDLPITKLN